MSEPNSADNPPPEQPPPLPPIPVLRPADDSPLPTPGDGIPVLQPVWEIPTVLPAADGPDGPLEPGMYYPAPKQPSHFYFWFFLIVAGISYVAMLIVTEETRRIALAGLESLPFLGLALLAYGGEQYREMRLVTIIYWLFLVGVVAASTMFMTFASVMDPALIQSLQAGRPRPAPGTISLLQPDGGVRLALAGFGTIIAIGLGALGFMPSLRRAFSRWHDFDAGSFVHAVALATTVGLTAVLIVPLLAVGEPVFLVVIRNFKDLAGNEALAALSDPANLRDQLYTTMWLVPCAIMAVGFPLKRTLRAALERGGLVTPTFGQVLFGIGIALFLAVVMTFFDNAVSWWWKQRGWPTTDSKQFEELMKWAINPLGAVVIGVTAGLGEELFARGVLQPRLGILLSNLLFTAMHALQYNWDGLLSVFVIGLILGVIRKKTNTTTSAIVHGTYDFILVLATYAGVFELLFGNQ